MVLILNKNYYNYLYLEFVQNNIGQIIGCNNYNNNYTVAYYNIPENIKIWFDTYNYIMAININDTNIKYYSKNKEELELILLNNKYNI